MQVVNNSGLFGEAELDELVDFVTNSLLSDIEIEWIDRIWIRNAGLIGYYGYWDAEFSFDQQNQIDGIKALIVLNSSYLKTIDLLKETLAHEYGHHWTLSYLAVNQGIDYTKSRMPTEYYNLRGLNEQVHAHDYSNGWRNCDKEIAAEDYRFLFAAHPYNRDHRMVNNSHGELELPNEAVENYIRNLRRMQFD